jgi:E3 ubiquitin-protein ligase AIP2
MSATDEAAVEARLQALRQRLGKKQQFEEAVADLAAAVWDHYSGASPALRKSVRPTRPDPTLALSIPYIRLRVL